MRQFEVEDRERDRMEAKELPTGGDRCWMVHAGRLFLKVPGATVELGGLVETFNALIDTGDIRGMTLFEWLKQTHKQFTHDGKRPTTRQPVTPAELAKPAPVSDEHPDPLAAQLEQENPQ